MGIGSGTKMTNKEQSGKYYKEEKQYTHKFRPERIL